MISEETKARAAAGGYEVYEIKRCCSPCFGAKCLACGQWLTKHDFDEEGACCCAEGALNKPGHFQHVCPRRREAQLTLDAQQ